MLQQTEVGLPPSGAHWPKPPAGAPPARLMLRLSEVGLRPSGARPSLSVSQAQPARPATTVEPPWRKRARLSLGIPEPGTAEAPEPQPEVDPEPSASASATQSQTGSPGHGATAQAESDSESATQAEHCQGSANCEIRLSQLVGADSAAAMTAASSYAARVASRQSSRERSASASPAADYDDDQAASYSEGSACDRADEQDFVYHAQDGTALCRCGSCTGRQFADQEVIDDFHEWKGTWWDSVRTDSPRCREQFVCYFCERRAWTPHYMAKHMCRWHGAEYVDDAMSNAQDCGRSRRKGMQAGREHARAQGCKVTARKIGTGRTDPAEALDGNEIPRNGYSISVNGLGAGGNAGLADGDVVTLVPKVEGGIS